MSLITTTMAAKRNVSSSDSVVELLRFSLNQILIKRIYFIFCSFLVVPLDLSFSAQVEMLFILNSAY